MDGAHDMGGTKGFGPVVPEPNEPVFHGDWERRAFALTVAMSRVGGWNTDMSRFARENRPPEDYLRKSYFQIWLAGLETLMIERGLIAAPQVGTPGPLALDDPDRLRDLLETAGFEDIEIEPTRTYNVEDARAFLTGQGVDVDAIAPLVDGKFMSAFIRAQKPGAGRAKD